MEEKIAVAVNPEDWPKDGSIDLAIHDLPHASSTTEWWYLNTHIETKEGRQFAIFASFFRRFLQIDEETKQPDYAHSVTWALIDIEKDGYYPVSLLDQRAPEIGLNQLNQGKLLKDPRLKKSAIEMLERGNVPLPDRLFQQEIKISLDKLDIDFDGNQLVKQTNGDYYLKLVHPEGIISAEITFSPQIAPVRHGDNGVVKGVSAEDMFYYFIPNCKVNGLFSLKENTFSVDNCGGWYDHEFGKYQEGSTAEDHDVAWNWLSVQMDNGKQLSAYDLIDTKDNYKNCGKFLILIDENGNQTNYEDFTLEPSGSWVSTRTFTEYPTGWKLTVPALDLELDVKASVDRQEFITVISKPAFWEGRIDAVGTYAGKPVKGPGFVERSGFFKLSTMEDFFKSVTKATMKSVKEKLPLDPTREDMIDLIASNENEHLLEGVEKQAYSDALIKPIREIVDRGGKCWRSYAPLACCDVVGGDSQKSIDWLSLPEVVHVGSLMVDDVEDKSEIRRGGPAAHLIFGEAPAINSGTACYFLGQIVVKHAELDDATKLRIYDLYFQGLRAVHTGQALDIAGLHNIMDEVVASGDGAYLEKRIKAIHTLKSAVPASFLAQVGGILGGGNDEQVNGLKFYFEALGLAFQIMDDVLNLKGFERGLKDTGEDLAEGKITYPVAKAMGTLEKADREKLWAIIAEKTRDKTKLMQAISIIDSAKGFEASEEDARKIVDAAWNNLQPTLPDSFAKLMLRAFGEFVLERHY